MMLLCPLLHIIITLLLYLLDPKAVIKKCFMQLTKGYDPEMGGFSKAPKFPQPANFNFLLRYYAAVVGSDDEDYGKQALNMVLHTLEMMSKGITVN